MTELLPNHFNGTWQTGTGQGTVLTDPVLGTELVRVDATGLDLAAGFAFAREQGGQALRALTYVQRAGLLAAAQKVLQANRDAYYDIATANSGTVKNDSAVDIDGGIFTLGTYAKLGEGLGERFFLADGDSARLGKDPLFQSQHVLTPTRGVALFINAFNFPSWGLWEKAAPALLSGVPVIVKPATATAWLTQRMVKDVVDAGIFPAGALSIVCGSSAGLMDQLQPFDVVSFTGSADTAAVIRSHPAVTQRSVRVNIEADSVNSAVLLPGEAAGSEAFDLFVKEVAREMTVKSGQKCTAIRRVLVPEELYAAAAQAISARLAKTTVGNPRNEAVRMGALVSRAQLVAVKDGLEYLKTQAEVLHDGSAAALVDADANIACCVGPTLLGVRNAAAATALTASMTPKSLVPWPHWCRTAPPGAAWTTRLRWCAAARVRWWRLYMAATRRRWRMRQPSWPTAMAACTSFPPTWPRCRPDTATSCRSPCTAAPAGPVVVKNWAACAH